MSGSRPYEALYLQHLCLVFTELYKRSAKRPWFLDTAAGFQEDLFNMSEGRFTIPTETVEMFHREHGYVKDERGIWWIL